MSETGGRGERVRLVFALGDTSIVLRHMLLTLSDVSKVLRKEVNESTTPDLLRVRGLLHLAEDVERVKDRLDGLWRYVAGARREDETGGEEGTLVTWRNLTETS